MAKKSELTLEELKKEIDRLKKEKERKMALSNSMAERNKLLNEIKQLEQTKKSPSALKSFGKSFGRGLGMIWKGIKTASRNLDKNDPELRKFGKGMMPQKQNQMQPFNPVTQSMYAPSSQNYYSKTPRKMKTSKLKKTKGYKKKKMKTPKRMAKEFKQQVNQPAWGLP